jgi:hypothetical protein
VLVLSKPPGLTSHDMVGRSAPYQGVGGGARRTSIRSRRGAAGLRGLATRSWSTRATQGLPGDRLFGATSTPTIVTGELAPGRAGAIARSGRGALRAFRGTIGSGLPLQRYEGGRARAYQLAREGKRRTAFER